MELKDLLDFMEQSQYDEHKLITLMDNAPIFNEQIKVNALIHLLNDVATNLECTYPDKKMAIAKLFVNSNYNDEIQNTLFKKIIHYNFDHESPKYDYAFSELLAAMLEKKPDFIKLIMTPQVFWASSPAQNGKKIPFYFCENLFAMAAIRKNLALYQILQNFVTEEELSDIREKHFFSFAPSVKLTTAYRCLSRNSKYVYLEFNES